MRFCGMCGARLDEQTGLCPNCNQETGMQQPEAEVEVPAVTEPVATEVVEETPVEEKTPKKKSKAMVTLVSVLGAICLVIAMFSALTIYVVQSTVRGESQREVLQDVDLVDMLTSTGIYTKNNAEKFANYVNKEFGTDVTHSDITDLLSRVSMEKVVADKLTKFARDFGEGETEITLTRSEIERLLNSNKKVIDRKLDMNMDEEDAAKIADWILESKEEDAELVIMDSRQLKNDSSNIYYGLKLILSQALLWVMVAVSVLVICLLMINSLNQGSAVVGVVSVVFGALWFVPAALTAWLSVIWEMLTGGLAIGTLVGNILAAGLIPGAGLLVLGVVLLVARKVIGNLRKRKVAAV